MRRLLAAAAVLAAGVVAVPVGNAGMASAATCTGTGTVQIISLSFNPASIAPGQRSTATMVAQNCTAQAITATSTWAARLIGPGTGIPPGCPAIDPLAQATNFPAGGQVTVGLGYLTFASCTATALQLTVTVNGAAGPLASQTATLLLGGSASATPTTSPGSCAVTYARNSEWPGGFVAAVTITNTGTSAINGWVLTFTFPGDQVITNAWNATVAQTGAAVTATNMPYNKVIAAGVSTSFGFQGTWHTSDASPAVFAVNGQGCAVR
jgi:hypothetical protein